MSIAELPAKTINLIKSSQVITSLTSIVKELIENSLDAESSSIFIKLCNFGFDKLEVKDNGIGIKEEDVQYVAKPHFTSKIQKFEDLDSLMSYGFRGEALSSLCAVADVTISTKSKNDSFGFAYTFNPNGEVVSKKPAAVTTGTSVTVQNLFKSVPVRRNYYSNSKRRKEELRKVENLIMAFAVVKPNVHFTLSHDKNLIFQKPVATETKTAIHSIFKDLTKKLVFKHFKTENLEVKIWLPQNVEACCSASSPDKLFICVNGRPVSHKSMEKLVKAYYSRKEDGCHGRYPIGVLLIQVPSHCVDVNLEPNKTKILFRDETVVLESIQKLLVKIYGEILPTGKGREKELSDGEELDIVPCTLAPPSQTSDSERETFTPEVQRSKSLIDTSKTISDLPPPFREDRLETSRPIEQDPPAISPRTPPTPLDFMPSPSQLENIHEKTAPLLASELNLDESAPNGKIEGSVNAGDNVVRDNTTIPKLNSRKLSLSKSRILGLDERATVDNSKPTTVENLDSSIVSTTHVEDVIVTNGNLPGNAHEETPRFHTKDDAPIRRESADNILSTPTDESLTFLKENIPLGSETTTPDVANELLERKESCPNGDLFESFPNRQITDQNVNEKIDELESSVIPPVSLHKERNTFSGEFPTNRNNSVSNGIESAVNGRSHLGTESVNHKVDALSNAPITNRRDILGREYLTNGQNGYEGLENVIYVDRIETEHQGVNQSFKTVRTEPELPPDQQGSEASWSRGTVMNGDKNIQTVEILRPPKFQEKNPSVAPKRKIWDEEVLEGRPQRQDHKKLKIAPAKKIGESRSGFLSTPRRTESAFSLFAKVTRKQIIEENPGADFTVVAQKIATRWRNADFETKQFFEDKANEMNNSQSDLNRSLMSKPKDSEPSVKMVFNKIEAKVNFRPLAKLKPWHNKCLAVPFTFDQLKRKMKEKKKKNVSLEGIVGCLKGVNGWVFRHRNDLFTLNSSRLNEVLLFTTLVKSFSIPTIKMEDPVPLGVQTLGLNLWKILLTLNHTPSAVKRELMITDPRIASNGFKIVLFPGESEGDMSSGAITDIADSVPNYGLSDLSEILEKLSIDSRVSLRDSRPHRLFSWLKIQSMRMARSSPHITDLRVLEEKFAVWSKEEKRVPKTDARCLHGNHIFSKIISLDQLR